MSGEADPKRCTGPQESPAEGTRPRMLSITEMALLGVGALLLFGPEQLPVVMKKAGRVMRDVQNTSQGFIREMERAADEVQAPIYEPPAHPQPPPEPGEATTAADVPPESPYKSPDSAS